MFVVSLFGSLLQNLEAVCPGSSGNITQYQIRLQTVSLISIEEIVKIVRCKARRCNHTIEPPTNASLTYDSVSVAAENMVGVGAARICTTQTISEY